MNGLPASSPAQLAQRHLDPGQRSNSVDDNATGREAFETVTVVRASHALIDQYVRPAFHLHRFAMRDEPVPGNFRQIGNRAARRSRMRMV